MIKTTLLCAALAGLSMCDGGSMGPRGPQGAPGEVGTAGVRLKPRAFKGPDGSAGSLGWRDDYLGFTCRWIDVAGGTTCAAPETATTDRYRDAECISPIVWTDLQELPTWWVDARATAVYKRADTLPEGSPAWQWVDGECVASGPCTSATCAGLQVDTFLVTVIVNGENLGANADADQ